MDSEKGRLVNFANSKNLELIGMLFEPDVPTDCIVIHVHGNYGNFYNNKFIWHMSKAYTKNGMAFLSFNLSSHDGLCEGYRLGELDYIGGGVADYNESILDIDAAIKYVKHKGYTHVILQGHSLGCDKIIEYILKHPNGDCGVILLSPVDSYAVQKRWLELHKGETIQDQIIRLKNTYNSCNETLDWLSSDEYGAEGQNADWIYKIPVTKKALLSILQGSAFKYLNLENNVDFFINNQVFVFLGKRDGLQMSSQAEMRLFLDRHMKNAFFEDSLDSDHDIIGVENELCDKIVAWIKNRFILRYI